MWLLAVLLLLPFIYLFSWIAAPFLYVGARTVHFAEKVGATYGGVVEFLFFALLIWLFVFAITYKRIFWVPLVLVLLIATYFGSWY